jgi:acyl-[acyl-carrier-protein]-phospholipid O-acyltransferase/long-chain-fatty-acid--[acyl-carrier-protein] ligase
MRTNQFNLLKDSRFLPLCMTQSLQAFNDNAYKLVMLTLISFRLVHTAQSSSNYQALGAGLFILPFFLFSATAGQLADKYSKPKLIRMVKLCEIVLMIIGAVGFWYVNIPVMMGVLFLLGTHSTFFSPLKYAALPEQLKRGELLGANALVETSLFSAILLGTLFGTLVVGNVNHMTLGLIMASSFLILVAIAGYVGSRYIPDKPGACPSLKIDINIVKATWHIVNSSLKDRNVALAIFGLSWFWLFGGILLAELPSYVKYTLNATPNTFAFFLFLFTFGIAVGSLVLNRLLKGRANTQYVPLAVFGMSIFLFDFYLATPRPASSGVVMGLDLFLTSFQHWRLSLDLFLLAFCGGVFTVPLFALLQVNCEKTILARVMAANNIVNSLFMVIGAICLSIMTHLYFTIPGKLLTLAACNAIVALYICKLLPYEMLKTLISGLLRLLFKVKVKGMDHFYETGDKVIIIANHTSYLDSLLLSAFLPDRFILAINTHVSERFWVKPFLSLVDAFPVDPTNPMATKSIIKLIKEGKKCIIFPEGRRTVTGGLMKVYEGSGMVADKSGADLLPICISGAEHSIFSCMKGKIRIRLLPKITLTILPPRKFSPPKTASSRARRAMVGTHLYNIMAEVMFESSAYQQTIFKTLIKAKRIHGRRHVIIEDIKRKPMTYQNVLMKTWILGTVLKKITKEREHVGLFLPTSNAAIVSFFALVATHRIPAMLNYSMGAKSLLSTIKTGKINQIVTARQFIEKAKLQDVVQKLKESGVKVHYLEELNIGLFDKLSGMFKSLFNGLFYQERNADDTAVILFTSGSEGNPKGVVLSHKNILANCYQMDVKIAFTPQDVIFNALPIFHCFGLTAGTLLPVLFGIRCFSYPSPLHYRIVPELVYDTGASIMFGTNTFLTGYAKYAHPYDFYNIRYIFAGAEKLSPETRTLYADQFGVRIFEGYGATETAPVLSTNTPMQYRSNTTGTFLPCIEYRVEPVEGISEGGRLFVRGPNVMKGYLLNDNSGELHPLEKGWYDTGDIVSIDEEGFLSLLGRAKRFAKVAGEMVSLTYVETLMTHLWPDNAHAVISVSDPRKGEKLILLTDYDKATREKLVQFFKREELSELMIPREIRVLKEIPVLTSGKTDYVTIREKYFPSNVESDNELKKNVAAIESVIQS